MSEFQTNAKKYRDATRQAHHASTKSEYDAYTNCFKLITEAFKDLSGFTQYAQSLGFLSKSQANKIAPKFASQKAVRELVVKTCVKLGYYNTAGETKNARAYSNISKRFHVLRYILDQNINIDAGEYVKQHGQENILRRAGESKGTRKSPLEKVPSEPLQTITMPGVNKHAQHVEGDNSPKLVVLFARAGEDEEVEILEAIYDSKKVAMVANLLPKK